MLTNYKLENQPTVNQVSYLYRQAQARQWQAADLPWSLGVTLNERQCQSGAHVLSQILYGEQTSYRIIEQLLAAEPDEEVRLFLRSQHQDEFRHIEVFTRYIGLLGAEVSPPNSHLAQLAEGMLALPTSEEKLVGMHILIEGMALEIFHSAAASLNDPLLRELLRRVFVDESRHVAFGIAHTRTMVARLDAVGRERVAREGGRYAALCSGLVRDEQSIAAEFGLDLRAIQNRTLRVLFRRLTQVGLLNALNLF